jgi:potassium efflux system protein
MSLVRILLLLLVCGLHAPLAAAAPATVPTAEGLQARLDGLAERKLPEAEQRAAQQSLEEALAHLKAAADSERVLRELKATLERAPQVIAENKRELERLRAAADPSPTEALAGLTLEELERRFAERNAELAEVQRALAEANGLIINAQTRPERAQAEISAGRIRAQAIDAALQSGREDNRSLTAERRDALAAEWTAVDALTRLRLQELAGNSPLLDLGQGQRELLTLRARRLEQEIHALQALINERRRAQAQQTVSELAAEPQAGEPAVSGLLARERETNRNLSAELLKATDRLNSLTQHNLQARQQLDALTQAQKALEEQIEVLQGSLLLSRILSQQQQSLPKLRLDADLTGEIADLRLYQFEIERQRGQLAAPEAYAEQLVAQAPAEQVNNETREGLRTLLATRVELLERLNRELNAQLNEAINLQLTETQLKTTADALRRSIDGQLFWIPSNKPLDLEWIRALPSRLERQLAEMPWGEGRQELWVGLKERPLVFLPVLLLTGLLLWRRAWLAEKVAALHRDIGHVHADSQLHTPLAILLTVLLALPGTLLLALGGVTLQADARGQNAVFGAALLQMAGAWLVFYTAYRILAHHGVAERHFNWPRTEVAALRSRMRRLGAAALAVVAVVTVAERQPAALPDDVVGVLVLLACYAAMAWLMGGLLSVTREGERTAPLRMLINLLLALMPLTLIGAVIAGYYYTAVKLTGRLLDTLYLLVLWRLLDAVVVRGLSVAARRLAYQRALSRRETGVREGAEGGEIEEPVLDIEQVNQQSLRLLRLGLLVGFVAALYGVWADLITVFSYLDKVVLYEFGGGEGVSPVPISLSDLLGALVIITIAFLLAGNLPGLLEVLVLSRLQLAQGSAYAITTLLSYVIVGVGFVAMLGTLGVSWDKLQWLVAALSVGLGFGLQEIFANFVSGLMILFERPMRIGDTVTVGNLSGTVSRIRIRATTIVDFDRKEIIVPNKTFVTSQLINWSLSDTVTRVTVKVGVAYGSDLALVRRLLLQIAEENPRVLKDPPPLVFFLNFGASTLDHELRVHVRELVDRNAAIDEINRRIDELFAEHGIEIAFAQMDVRIRNVAGGQTPDIAMQPGDGGAAGGRESGRERGREGGAQH